MDRSLVRRSFSGGESSELSDSSVCSFFTVAGGKRIDMEVSETVAVCVVGGEIGEEIGD